MPDTIPTHRADFERILNFSRSPRAVPAPMLHIKILARYWYNPSLILLETLFSQCFSVALSAIIPPAIPPATGTAPKIDNHPISLKISLEVIFSGSGISLFKSFLERFLFKMSTSFIPRILFFDLLRILVTSLGRLLFSNSPSTTFSFSRYICFMVFDIGLLVKNDAIFDALIAEIVVAARIIPS